jgi:hypothetical protein
MTIHFLPPDLDRYDFVVEEAIATCNGDLRGALKALIMANEFLERDIQELKHRNKVPRQSAAREEAPAAGVT